ncbi:MAG TPA: hypothetical protein PLP27_00425 [Crocinitomicaceae bacterium]|nr:hypothetical protein [Crocinitomicaceae bacterium]
MKNKIEIELKKDYQKKGRKHLFIAVLISVFIFFVFIPVTFVLILQLADGSGSISTFYQNMFGGYEYGWNFIIIQVLVIIGAMWFVGPVLAEQIIKKEKNYFWISVLAITSLWMILFLSSTLTSGIQNSFKYGIKGFESTVTNWFIFGFFLFLILGGLHGLLIGYFLGKKIKYEGKKYSELITNE